MTKKLILLIFLLMQSCTSGGARLPDGYDNWYQAYGYDSWYQASLPSVQESLQRIADKECCNEN
jgi:hypothetical protein